VARRGRWPWSRHPGQRVDRMPDLSDSAPADPGKAASADGAAAGDGTAAAPSHPWPVDPSPARIAEARAWLAAFPERAELFIGSLDIAEAASPAVAALVELAVGGRDACATLDAALRHSERPSPDGGMQWH
jgi:hypothetical protein